MGQTLNDPVIPFESQAAWEARLADQHSTSTGVWVKIAKKASGIPTVTFAEAIESALCYGWIDGQRNGVDEQWFMQRFTHRRARSNWSKINRAKAEQLIAEGRAQPAGGGRLLRHPECTEPFAVLHQIRDAKRPETRARRIEKFVAMLAAGKPYP